MARNPFAMAWNEMFETAVPLICRVRSVAKLVVEIPEPPSVTSKVTVGFATLVTLPSAGVIAAIVGLTPSTVTVSESTTVPAESKY